MLVSVKLMAFKLETELMREIWEISPLLTHFSFWNLTLFIGEIIMLSHPPLPHAFLKPDN